MGTGSQIPDRAVWQRILRQLLRVPLSVWLVQPRRQAPRELDKLPCVRVLFGLISPDQQIVERALKRNGIANAG